MYERIIYVNSDKHVAGYQPTTWELHRKVVAIMLLGFLAVLGFVVLASAAWADGAYKKGVEDGRHTIRIEAGEHSKVCELTDDLTELECE